MQVLGLYFSSAWSPACRSTTPLIASVYKALRARGKKLQLVYVSQDGSEEEYNAYRASMPWPALPYGGSLPALLAEIFHVPSIPCIVLLSQDGALISTDGVRLLRKHARAYPWSSETPPETPHQHLLFDRLMRHRPVDTGPTHDLPSYTPVDLLLQPERVSTLDEAVAAVRHCDRLCTLIAVQSHCVKNTALLKVALVQHTFTQLLPMPKPEPLPPKDEVAENSARSGRRKKAAAGGRPAEAKPTEAAAAAATAAPASEAAPGAPALVCPACKESAAADGAVFDHPGCPDGKCYRCSLAEAQAGLVASCVWRAPMLYAQQLDLMILLQRIIEHFASSVFSLDHTAAMDGVRMVVPACIAAIADAVMRTVALDIPSEVSVHLRGSERSRQKGFAIGAAALARQAAVVPVHTPELNTARCAALDYFNAQSGGRYQRIFGWERTERLEKGTSKWLGLVCADLAFPSDSFNTPRYVADSRELVIKNFPEFRCYRDIAFYLKLLLNPDIRRSPPKSSWSQKDAELVFHWDDGSERFYVTGFQDTSLSGRPRVKRGEMPPTERFASLAAPSAYTRPYLIESEDDVLHMWELPDFGSLDVGNARALGQHVSDHHRATAA